MNGKNDIFELIHALSVSERAYFKKFAYKIKNKESKDYIELFDAIALQKTYNETLLKNRLTHTKLFNNFSASKSYLINLIAETLTPLCIENTMHGSILKALAQIRFLIEKNAQHTAKKKIQQVKKWIKEYELFSYADALFHMEISLIPFTKEDETIRKLIIEEKIYAENCVQNLSQYIMLKEEWIYFRQNSQTYVRDASYREFIDSQLGLPLLSDINLAITTRSRFLFYYIRIGYKLLINDLESAFVDSCKQYVLIKENIPFRRQYNLEYINCLGNHLLRMINVNNYTDADEVIAKLEHELDANQDIVLKQTKRLNIIYAERAKSMHEKEFPRLLDSTELLDSAIQFYNKRKDIALSLIYDRALAYFYNDKFDDALHAINLLLNNEDLYSFKDLESYAHIIRLLCFIEQDRIFVFDNLFENLKKKLYRDKKLFKMENCILKMLETYSATSEDKLRHQILLHYKKEIEHLSSNPMEQNMLHYFNIQWWIEAKLHKKTIFSFYCSR